MIFLSFYSENLIGIQRGTKSFIHAAQKQSKVALFAYAVAYFSKDKMQFSFYLLDISQNESSYGIWTWV